MTGAMANKYRSCRCTRTFVDWITNSRHQKLLRRPRPRVLLALGLVIVQSMRWRGNRDGSASTCGTRSRCVWQTLIGEFSDCIFFQLSACLNKVLKYFCGATADKTSFRVSEHLVRTRLERMTRPIFAALYKCFVRHLLHGPFRLFG